jgi:hypothetical protein
MRKLRAKRKDRHELISVIQDALLDQRLAYNEHVPLPTFIADAIIERVYQQLPPKPASK